MKAKPATALVIILFVVALCYGVFVNVFRIPDFLTWDETDYIKASLEGIAVNAFEKQTLSLIEFGKLGIAKIKKQQPDVTELPSEFIDPFHLRHFHPPLPVYYWHLFLNINIETQDHLLRLSNILLQIICALSILFFGVEIFSDGSRSAALYPAGILTSFFITSDVFLHAFVELNFHTFFLVASVLFTLSFILYLQNPIRSNAVWLGLTSAIVLCTLETSPFIYFGALLFVFLFKQKSIFKIKWRTVTLALFISSIVLWPGIIFTLGPVKSWAMYVYRIFALSNEYEDVSVWATLVSLLKNNWLLVLLIVSGYVKLFFLARSDKSFSKVLLLPVVIGLLYGILMLPFTLNITYVFPAAGLIFLGSVPGLFKLMELSKFRIAITILVIASIGTLLLKIDFKTMKDSKVQRQENLKSDLAEVKKILSDNKPILADGGRIFSYYFPDDAELIYELFRVHNRQVKFAIRKNYEYVFQENELKNNFYGGVLIGKSRNYTPEQFEQLKNWGYKFRELNSYYLFHL